MGEDLDFSGDEALQVDLMSVYWMWLHWDQYTAIKTPKDLEELQHIVGEFYSVPPGSDSWAKSPLGRPMLDDSFVEFVEHAIEKKKAQSLT